MRGKTNYENLTLKFVINLIKTFGHDISETFTKRELKLRSLIFTLRDKKISMPEKFYIELAKQLNVPYFDDEILKDINYLASALPYSVMRKNLVFLLQITDEKIVIATSNPFNFALFRELERIFKRKLELYIASTESIEYALDRGYREIHQMKAMDELKIKTPEYSASNVLYTWQKNFLFIISSFNNM